MVSCLTLVTSRHLLAASKLGSNRTACGLSIAAEYCTPAMFALADGDVTCAKCLEVGAKPDPLPARRRSTPVEVVTRVIETLLPTQDAEGLHALFSARIDASVAAQRLQRLHALFPDWQARIRETIADKDKVFARYAVSCRDEFGLLGTAKQTLARDDSAIFRMGADGIAAVDPLRDSFDFWVNLGVTGRAP